MNPNREVHADTQARASRQATNVQVPVRSQERSENPSNGLR